MTLQADKAYLRIAIVSYGTLSPFANFLPPPPETISGPYLSSEVISQKMSLTSPKRYSYQI